MPTRPLRKTKLSARAAYALNMATEEKLNKRGRGRPKLNEVKPSAPLSKAPAKGKSVIRKRKRSSGGVAAKVENNSSEADCSSEGEEQASDDEVKEQVSNEDSEEEEMEENSSNEENSANDEDSDVDAVNNTLTKSESGSISMKSTGEDDDDNEIRYSLPITAPANIIKLEPSPNQKMDKKVKGPSPQKSLSSGQRTTKGAQQISSTTPKSLKPNSKSPKTSTVKKEPIQDETNIVSPTDKKGVKNYDNSSRKSTDAPKDSEMSEHILKEIIKKYETLKKQYKSKSKEDSDESQDEIHPAKRLKQSDYNDPGKYSFSRRYKINSTGFSIGKVRSKNSKLSMGPAAFESPGRNRIAQSGNIAADEAFRWLLNPLEPEEFFLNIFEKMPYHINRKKYSYYKELFSCENLNTMLKENDLMYGVHIDVLKYENGERKPVEAVGKAYNSNAWDDFKQGYSVRIRNPQAYNKNIWNICSLLQEYFSNSVGCNIYLTPPSSQGFPPHYDDIDAFIVQVEGAKIWKVYAPRNPNEELARYSSTDFQENEIGQPIHEIVLKPGDMLYIPRGYIHQAHTGDLEHSMHLTFSTNQLNTWGDLMLQASQKALERAILNEVEFRKSVPRDFMEIAGSAFPGDRRSLLNFQYQMKMLAKVSLNYIDPVEAIDMHALRFIRSSLPPVFNKVEKQSSIHGNGTQWIDGEIISKSPIDLETQIRLIRKRNLRLIIDESGPKLYHSLENKRDPSHPDSDTQEEVYVDFDMAGVQPFAYLLKMHPKYVSVSNLPLDDFESQIAFATSLYENGLLMTKEPLQDFKEADWNNLTNNDIPMIKEKSFLNL